MDKINFNNSKGLKIVGNLYSVSSNSLIIIAHGFMNNKSSNGRFDNLAESLNDVDYDALAIDFSGCGDSDDDIITLKNQIDDLNSAIEFALLKGYEKISLFGNSLGTLVCLRAYRKEIITMILVGALTDSMNYNWDDYFSKKQISDLHENGFFFSDNDRKHKISKQTLLDFKEINQKDLINNVNCPILIIHGNNSEDEEELQLLERSKRALSIMSSNSKLKIIEGGTHGLSNDWDEVIDITKLWYNKFM